MSRQESELHDQLLTHPQLAAAAECARHGLPVYAARPRSKSPLHRGWQRAATTKLDYLAEVWTRTPTANVGIACRGVAVLDADSRRGVDAVEELGLPTTTSVSTKRGTHWYFFGNAPTLANILPDVEIRGKGSGVLGPGSVHPSGHEYEWEIAPWEQPPIGIPEEIQHLIDERRGTAETVSGYVFEGNRNTHLLRMAGSLRGRFGVGELEPVLLAINEIQCRPPLPREEVARIARSASQWEAAPEWLLDPVGYCFGDTRLSAEARVVLRLLVDHADGEGRCYPGVRRLAKLSGRRPNTVLKATRELEDADRIRAARARRGNRYTLRPLPTKGGSSVTPSVTPAVTEEES